MKLLLIAAILCVSCTAQFSAEDIRRVVTVCDKSNEGLEKVTVASDIGLLIAVCKNGAAIKIEAQNKH
jgi:hypothetical protein